MNGQPISDDTWERIRIEFSLPTLELVRRRLSELMEDPELMMRQLVRVFIPTPHLSEGEPRCGPMSGATAGPVETPMQHPSAQIQGAGSATVCCGF